VGNFSQKITLKNAGDLVKARDGLIRGEDVRQVDIDAIVDTGASVMFITEDIRQKLGLAIDSNSYAKIANGTYQACRRTEPVSIHWKNRSTSCPAMVMPGATENLMGAIPLEGMDLKVNPVDQCLEGVHGADPVYLAL